MDKPTKKTEGDVPPLVLFGLKKFANVQKLTGHCSKRKVCAHNEMGG